MANAPGSASLTVNAKMAKFATTISVRMLVILSNVLKKVNVIREYADHNYKYAQPNPKNQKPKQPFAQIPDPLKKNAPLLIILLNQNICSVESKEMGQG